MQEIIPAIIVAGAFPSPAAQTRIHDHRRARSITPSIGITHPQGLAGGRGPGATSLDGDL